MIILESASGVVARGTRIVLGPNFSLTEDSTGVPKLGVAASEGASVSSVTGTANRLTAIPTTGNVVIDIDGAYVGQTSITTVGSLSTGSTVSGFGSIVATTGDFSGNTEVAGVLTLNRTDPILNFSDVSTVLRVRLTSPSADNLSILDSAATAGAAVSMGALTATTLQMDDGSVGSPSLFYTAQTQTGFYRPASNTVGVAMAGGERIRFGASWIHVGTTFTTPPAGGIQTEGGIVVEAGEVLIGTTTPATGSPRLDVVDSGGIQLMLATNTTDATDKSVRIATRHYTNAEQGAALFYGVSDNTNNTLNFGGGTGTLNAATIINFYTAANNTTLTGTLRLDIDSGGAADFQGNAVSMGALTVSGAITQTDSSGIIRDVTNSLIAISGGNSTADGGNILMYGSTASPSNTIAFRTTTLERMRLNSSGNLLIGTTTAATGAPRLDVVGTGPGAAITIADNTTDATLKVATFLGRHYTNAEQSIIGMQIYGLVGSNIIRIGGADSNWNAATVIEFYTAANTTTLTGTLRLDIGSDGAADFQGNAVSMGALTATTGTFSNQLKRTFSADAASGITLESTATDQLSPRLFFYNTTNAAQGCAILLGANSRLDFYTGSTPESSTGTARMQMTTAALNPVTSGLLTLGTSGLPWGAAFVGALTATGATFTDGNVSIARTGNDPRLIIIETDAAVDNEIWDFRATGTQFRFQIQNDAQSVTTPWLTVDRTGTTVDSIEFPSAASILIGTTTAATGGPRLDVVGVGVAAAIVLATSTTDVTNKDAMFGVRHSTNIEESFAGMIAQSQTTNNVVKIGGGTHQGLDRYNAATIVQFYTAANITTLTGTIAADITGVGTASLFHARGDIQIGSFGRFDSASSPNLDDVVRYNGTKWIPVALQFRFTDGDVTAQAFSDSTAAAFVDDGRAIDDTPAPVAPSAAPLLTAGYKSVVVDMEAHTLPADKKLVVQWSTDSGTTWSNDATVDEIVTTGKKIVHTKLLIDGTTYRYRFRERGATDSSPSPETADLAPLSEPDITVATIILASQISTVDLSSISANIGVITAGLMQNVAKTHGILLSGAMTDTDPAGWNRFINFVDETDNFIEHERFKVHHDGTVEISDGTNTLFSVNSAGTAAFWRDSASEKFKIDLTNRLLTIVDEQGTPRTRVKIGEISTGTADWGIQIFNNAGTIIADMQGSNLLLQDSAVKFKIDFTGRLLTVIDEQGTPRTRVKLGEINTGTSDWGLQIFNDVGVLLFDAQAANLIIGDQAGLVGINVKGTLPSSWTSYLDFTATGSNAFLKHTGLTLEADGDADFSGIVSSTQIISGSIALGPNASSSSATTLNIVHDRTDAVDASHINNSGEFTPSTNSLTLRGMIMRAKLDNTTRTGTVFEQVRINHPSFVSLLSAAGSTLTAYHLRIGRMVLGTFGGTFTAQYGIKIEDLIDADTDWAIHTGKGLVHFGDNVDISLNGLSITDTGASSFLRVGGTDVATGTPRVDIIGQSNNPVLTLTNTSGDVTQKQGYITTRHWTNTEETIATIFMESNSSTNILHIGGGDSLFNAATAIEWYTAANNTTLTGTRRMLIDSSGNLGIDIASPQTTQGLHIGPTMAFAPTSARLLSRVDVSASGTTYELGRFEMHRSAANSGTDILMQLSYESTHTTGTTTQAFAFAAVAQLTANGTITSLYGGDFTAQVTAGSGTITNLIAIRAKAVESATATVTNAIGLDVVDVTGATNNFAIRTGLGDVSFGGSVSGGDMVLRVGSATTDSGTGAVTTEVTLHTITVPADSMGTNGGIRIIARAKTAGSAGSKTIKVKVDGVQIASITFTGGENGSCDFSISGFNRAATNDQKWGGMSFKGVTSQVPVLVGLTASDTVIDTTASFNVTLTGQTPTNSDDEVTGEMTVVELIKD